MITKLSIRKGKQHMTNAQLKLIFAGMVTMVALLCGFTVMLACILKGLAADTTLAYCGPFLVIVTSGITFFLGNSNGINLVQEGNGS